MKKPILTFLFALMIHLLMSQSFSSFINYVNSLPEANRQVAIDSFMMVITPLGIPYINTDTANFIFQGTANTVNLPGDFTGWDPGVVSLENVTGTDFWHVSGTFETNARLDYKYVLNGSDWILDPLNPNQVSGGFGPNSELAMPDYVQPWEIEEITGVPLGTIETTSLASSNTGSAFQIKIYLPTGYNPNRPTPYPTAYFQDGFEYLTLGSADHVLDNLIHENLLDTLIAVFVKPNNRNEEYAGNMRDEYRLFFVEELVPFIDENYNTIQEPWGRAVCGPSFGANISALISYNHPDVFGNCGLHSGAFWPNDFETYELIVNGPVKDIKWASVWGTYEGLYLNMRDYRDFLLDNNYELAWQELPEGHSWGQWRATIDELLPFFFPIENSAVPEDRSHLISRLKVTPNPIEQSASITYILLRKSKVKVSIHDLSGQLVWSNQCGIKQQGQQVFYFDQVNLDSGIYFCAVETDRGTQVVKIVKM